MNSNETGIEGLVNTMSGSIPQTITTYKEQMLTTDMMRRVQRTLGLEKEFSAAMLKEMISVSNIKDTNLLSVVVTAKDSKLATDIANTLAAEFSDFVADMNSQRLSKSSSFLQEKVQEEKVNLANALEEYKIFLAQSPGTSEIQSEIGSKSSRLNILKEELDKLSTEFARETLGVENDIKLKNTEIDNIDELIRITDKFIIQRQSVIKDSTVSGIVQAFGQDSSELLDMKLESEVVNPNYINLHSQYNSVLVEMEVLQQEKSNIESTYVITRGLIESEIHLITKSLEELKVTYAEKNNQEKLITKNVQRAESSYDQFVQSYEETRVAESADIGKSTILINSNAVIDNKPVGPKKLLNIVIAAVFGMMISACYIIIKHYLLNDQ